MDYNGILQGQVSDHVYENMQARSENTIKLLSIPSRQFLICESNDPDQLYVICSDLRWCKPHPIGCSQTIYVFHFTNVINVM